MARSWLERQLSGDGTVAFAWVVLLAVRFFPERTGLLMLTLLGSVASVLVMNHLYHPGTLDPTRVYEGTDTRAFALLIGA